MFKNPLHLQNKEKMERGQSIVLIALAFIGLVAFIGLAIDTGILFIGYGHLRRATDAAALAAAAQFRENYTVDQLNNSATEFLRLNGVDLDNASATVYTCATDTTLCQTGSSPKRKLVRVKASSTVKFSFLPILGINDATVTADANGEAATLDVVLIIDNSESMAKDESTGAALDPSICNPSNSCGVFAKVKSSANSLVDKILNKPAAEEEDRIAIIEFSNGWQHGNNRGTYVVLPGDGWTNNKADAEAAIDSLAVYDPGIACTSSQLPALGNSGTLGECRYYSDDMTTYQGLACPLHYRDADLAHLPIDNSTCPTTNIGGGLLLASNQFKNSARIESVWVEVLLTDGVPNATCSGDAVGTTCWPASHTIDPFQTDLAQPDALPIQYCPHILRDPSVPDSFENSSKTMVTTASGTEMRANYCQPNSAISHHVITDIAYDPQDYALDMAKYAACDPIADPVTHTTNCGATTGQGAIIFAIGLGPEIETKDVNGLYRGETILREIAAVGDDGNPATDPCSSSPRLQSCGNYYFSPSTTELGPIFDAIASRIFTRIAK
jgi:Flp pilus assembly protein TadG